MASPWFCGDDIPLLLPVDQLERCLNYLAVVKWIYMASEELSQQIQALTKAVESLAQTMSARFGVIDERFDALDARLGAVDARLDSLDKHFDAMDQRLTTIAEVTQENFDAVTKDIKNLDDAIKDLDLKWDEKFTEFKAGQTSLAANQDALAAGFAVLRRDIFHETGSRETADNAFFNTQSDHYKELDRRLRIVEAKFPDLARSIAA